MRKATQICTENDRLFVLCEDGTIWTIDVLDTNAPSFKWVRLPGISDEHFPKTETAPAP